MSNSTLTAVVAAIVAVVLAFGFFVGRAGAEHGATEAIGTEAVNAGDICVVSTFNPQSVHPDNVLLIGNGDEEISVPGVEDAAGAETETELVARSDELTFVVLLGETEATSLTVSVVCEDPPPPSSTVPSSTTTSPPTTLPPSTPEPPTVTTPTFTG